MQRVQFTDCDKGDENHVQHELENGTSVELQEQDKEIIEQGHLMEDLVDDEHAYEDEEDINSQNISLTDSQPKQEKSMCNKSNIRLLLSKGSLYLLGGILVVVCGVLSQYHPPLDIINGNYTECTYSNSTLNSTWNEL